MTKSEAIAAINNGETVTHQYMDSHEFVKLSKHSRYIYEFEDGIQVHSEMFWRDRNHDGWQNGWEIFTGTITLTK